MIFLGLSILSTTLLYLLFKWFAIKGVHVFEAIVINYLFAFGLGFLLVPDLPSALHHAFDFPTWTWGGLLLGFSFIGIFNITGKSAQLIGVSNTTIAGKMSLVLVVILFSLTNPEEQLSWISWIAIGLAILGIVFSSFKADGKKPQGPWMVYPVTIFLGSTLIDFMIPKLSETADSPEDLALYSCLPFFTAGLTGLVYVGIQKWRGTTQTFQFSRLEWMYGGLLGLVNFFSIFFLVKTINAGWMSKSSIVCINNLGVVMLGTLLAIVFFKEKLNKLNWIGLALALAALLLLLI
jgi:drug/metabolite transporter (DMT)-like permease